jgi:hypothetical protein
VWRSGHSRDVVIAKITFTMMTAFRAGEVSKGLLNVVRTHIVYYSIPTKTPTGSYERYEPCYVYRGQGGTWRKELHLLYLRVVLQSQLHYLVLFSHHACGLIFKGHLPIGVLMQKLQLRSPTARTYATISTPSSTLLVEPSRRQLWKFLSVGTLDTQFLEDNIPLQTVVEQEQCLPGL